MIDLAKIKKLSEWQECRKAIENSVIELAGKLPKERVELQAKTMDEIQGPGYVRRRINYFVSEWERISAWLFLPEGKEEVPGILCCHQRAPLGKDECAGLGGDPMLAFAQHYAELGYAALAPDCVTAGERVVGRAEGYQTNGYYKDNSRMSVMGKMLLDHMHALDLFNDFKRVDPARIGVIGHGLGGANAIVLSAFDERVQTCVASCAFTRFQDDARPERWVDDAGFSYLPKLQGAIESKDFPLDWEHLLALCAPSPMLLFAASNDPVLSNPKSAEKAAKKVQPIYALLGAGHAVTREVMDLADEWFERWL